MARTPSDGEARREQILDAALSVFAEKGFARATNRDIAHKAGITAGLIYYYFKSKEDLLKAALEERSPVQIIAQITPEMLEQPPEILLPLVIQRVLSIVENEQFVGLVRVILPEVLHDTQLISPITLSFFQRMLDFLSHYLKGQVAKGTVRADLDVDAMMQIMVSSTIGLVMRRQILRDLGALQYSREDIAHALVEIFLLGIKPR